jgi:hypothetical protein
MVIFLRCLFVSILVAMLAGTVRASMAQALFDIPPEVYGNPWFQVTLLDAYFAFLTFFVWVAWKEGTVAARVLWGLAILLWGNFAMATYMLRELAQLDARGPLTPLFTEQRPGRVRTPLVLVAAGVAVYLVGAKNVLFG